MISLPAKECIAHTTTDQPSFQADPTTRVSELTPRAVARRQIGIVVHGFKEFCSRWYASMIADTSNIVCVAFKRGK